jgi:hypothetical protein
MRRTTLDCGKFRADSGYALVRAADNVIVPKPQNPPSSLVRLPIDVGIAVYGTFDLLRPKAPVSLDLFRRPVPAPAVPERRIAANREPDSTDQKIRASRRVPTMLSITDRRSPDRVAQCPLDLRPGSLDPGHV